MRSSSLKRLLEKMYPQHHDGHTEFQDELEARVMALYQSRYSQRRNWMAWISPKNHVTRYALGSLLVVALLGIACELPTSTPVAMGYHVTAQFERPGDATGAPLKDESALRAALADIGAEKIKVRVVDIDGGPVRMDLLVWTHNVGQEEVEGVIRDQLAAMPALAIHTDALTGNLEETLGKRIGRRLFDLQVSSESADELRAAILARLAAEGFDGSAVVDVQDRDGVRKITVEAGSTDGSREVADEIVIEHRDN